MNWQANDARIKRIHESGNRAVPEYYTRTYGLFRGRTLEALVVSTAWDSVFQFRLAGAMGINIHMVAEFDLSRPENRAVRESMLRRMESHGGVVGQGVQR